MPSEIKDKKDLDAYSSHDFSAANLKVVHRDSSWKLCSRNCSTISVFLYQGSVFYAQCVLANEMYICAPPADPHLKGCKTKILANITGSMEAWLFIETFCFYLYMFATVVFIAGNMIVSEFCSHAGTVADMSRAMIDFISYSSINLTWFAFNFVLCTLPPICIFLIKGLAPNLVKEENERSY